MLTANEVDLPVVSLYAVREGEDRGSFIMDHVPVVPCSTGDVIHAIERALEPPRRRGLEEGTVARTVRLSPRARIRLATSPRS